MKFSFYPLTVITFLTYNLCCASNDITDTVDIQTSEKNNKSNIQNVNSRSNPIENEEKIGNLLNSIKGAKHKNKSSTSLNDHNLDNLVIQKHSDEAKEDSETFNSSPNQECVRVEGFSQRKALYFESYNIPLPYDYKPQNLDHKCAEEFQLIKKVNFEDGALFELEINQPTVNYRLAGNQEDINKWIKQFQPEIKFNWTPEDQYLTYPWHLHGSLMLYEDLGIDPTGKYKKEFYATASAVAINSWCILTSAHNVLREDNKHIIDRLTFYPSMHLGLTHNKGINGIAVILPHSYFTQPNLVSKDFAVILLEKELDYKQYCEIGCPLKKSKKLKGKEATLVGYPGGMPCNGRYMVTETIQIDSIKNDETIIYKERMCKGYSGSSICYKYDNKDFIIGSHNQGNFTTSSAVFINEYKKEYINHWAGVLIEWQNNKTKNEKSHDS